MTRVRIEYFDQNEGFRPFLPRRGSVAGKLQSLAGDDWDLVCLDEPFEMQIVRLFQFKPIRVNRFLIRSRWPGRSVGDSEPTSVFILLVEEGALLHGDAVDIEKYEHAAWGMCHTE